MTLGPRRAWGRPLSPHFDLYSALRKIKTMWMGIVGLQAWFPNIMPPLAEVGRAAEGLEQEGGEEEEG